MGLAHLLSHFDKRQPKKKSNAGSEPAIDTEIPLPATERLALRLYSEGRFGTFQGVLATA